MPFRKKRRGGFRKKRRGGRRRVFNKRGRKGNGGQPRYLKYYGPGARPSTMPQNFQVKMVYSENHIVTSSSNFKTEEYNPSNYLSPRSLDTQSYKLFDQLVNIWEVFVPMAYKMTIVACNENIDQVAVGLYMTGRATVAGDMDTAMQQYKVVYKICSGASGGRNQCTVSQYRSQKEISGVNPLYEKDFWSIAGGGASRSTKIQTFYKNMFDQPVISVPVLTTLITYTRMMTRFLTPVAVETALQTAAERRGVVAPVVMISPISNVVEEMKVADPEEGI